VLAGFSSAQAGGRILKPFGVSGLAEVIKGRRLSGYSRFILLLGVFLIAGLCLFVRYQINYDYDRTITEASTETMNLTIAFEEHVRRIVSDADKDLLNLKLAYEQDGLSSTVFASYAMIANKNDPMRNLIAVYNEQGVVVASFIENVLGVNRSDRDYFLVHRNDAGQNLVVGKPIQVRTSGRTTIPLSRRINKPDGSFGGIVYISLRTDYFLSFYQKIDLGTDGLISLTGSDGFVRARRVGDDVAGGQDIKNSEFWRNIQSGAPSGTYQTKSFLDGTSRIDSYRVMPDYPLVVAVAKTSQVALAGYEQRKKGYILGSSLASLFILALCGLLVNRHEKLQAKNEALQVKEEELQAQNEELLAKEEELLKQRNQLQGINATMEEEIMERQAAQEALSDAHDALVVSDTRYRGLFEHMRKAFVYFEIVMDDAGRPIDHAIVSVNRSFERIFGRKAVDVIGERWTYAFPARQAGLFRWLRKYSEEVLKDPSIDFEQQVSAGDKWYQISAYSPEKGYIAVLVADITESMQHQQQLKYYADEVAATNTELKSFVNTIAHDFRSPMVNLKGFSTELGHTLTELKQIVHAAESSLPQEVQAKVDELLEKDVPDAQQFINSSVDRLNRMVDALLTLSRMGRREMSYKEVDMSKLVTAVLQSYKHQIGEDNIKVEVGELPKIQTDTMTMEQIIGNLVDNAIKYLAPGREGKIEVSCSENDHEYLIGVKDNGRGIAAIDHEKIFEPFRRSGKHDQPGEGLGLAYVRTLVRKLGGKVWCESEVGIGTTMSFTIPKKRV